LKTAIISDWLSTYAGAERCVESFFNIFPDAGSFALVDFLNNREREIILKNKQSEVSFIQYLPFAKKYFRYYLPLFSYAIESFDLREYDLILSSSHSVAKNVLTTSEQIHICYCHTPMRYAWDMYFDYLQNVGKIEKFLLSYFLNKIRIWDYIASQRVDFFIANSNFVRKRIKKIYNRQAKVIYPPVDVDKFEFCERKEEYYVTLSRLVPYKRVDLIVKAFIENKKRLIVIGDGEEMKHIKKIASKNIEITGFLSRDEINDILKKAKAFVYAAKEDFGISPVEAQACGTPVIALNKGGTAESVCKECGVLFNNQTIEDINKAVFELEKNYDKFNFRLIRQNALKYSRKRFEEEITNFIKEVI
jgi:glycosyltransferase involved in cell wall biosynthesis